MVVLVWLAIAVGALLALVLLLVTAVLLVPVEMQALWGERGRRLALSGPGLRVSYDAADRATELRVLSVRLKRWAGPSGRRREAARKKERPRRRRRRGVSLRKAWVERGRAVAALRGFLRRVSVRRLDLDTVVASSDPALTGWLSAVAYAGRAALPPRVRSGVRVRPDFGAEAPRVSVDAALRLQPVHAAVLAVRMWGLVRRTRAAPREGEPSRLARRFRKRPPAGGGRKERGP